MQNPVAPRCVRLRGPTLQGSAHAIGPDRVAMQPVLSYFFRLGFCVSADPADDLADLLAPLDLRVFDAAFAALGDVTFFGALV